MKKDVKRRTEIDTRKGVPAHYTEGFLIGL